MNFNNSPYYLYKEEEMERQNQILAIVCIVLTVLAVIALAFLGFTIGTITTQHQDLIQNGDPATPEETYPNVATAQPSQSAVMPPIQETAPVPTDGNSGGGYIYVIDAFYRWPALCVGPGLYYDDKWGDCLSDRPVGQLIADGTIQTPQQYLESNPELKSWMVKTCQDLEAKGDGSVYDYRVEQLGELPKYLPAVISCGMVDPKWQAEEVECDVSPIIANGADQALRPLPDGSGRNGHWVLVKRPVPIDNFAAGWNKPAAQIRELNPGISDTIPGCTAVLIQIY